MKKIKQQHETAIRGQDSDAGDGPFKLPVRYCMSFLAIDDLALCGALLRTLERRGFLHCIQRGTATRGDVPGKPTLWRFTGLDLLWLELPQTTYAKQHLHNTKHYHQRNRRRHAKAA